MLKPALYIICLCLACTTITAQKQLVKSWDASAIHKIEVISDEVFTITVVSAVIDTVGVVINMDGEHSEQLVLAVSQRQGVLSLAPEFRPYFEAPNDKLAAHKVLGIVMEIYIPQRCEFNVEAAIASVTAEGSYNKITAQLHDGSCTLTNFKGNATLFTRHGDIKVFAKGGVGALVSSKRGEVQNELQNKNGPYIIEAKSVNGDVIVMPTQ